VPWIASVRRGRWDTAFELSNHNTHSYYNCLLALAAGAPERIGFDHPQSRPALTRRVPPPETTLHFSLAPLRLLRDAGLPAPPAPLELPAGDPPSNAFRAWADREGIDGPRVVLHLGGRDAKAWPMEAWERVLPRAVALSPGPVVLVAGPEEQERLDPLARVHGSRVVRAPGLELGDLIHLLRGASAFVGCDSGVTHLSVALGTPTVALFFRSNPFHYAPLGLEHATVLLADPYGAYGDSWLRVPEGPPRSTLVPALPEDPAASRLGRPETGPRAVTAVEASLHAVLGRGEHDAGRPASPAAGGRTTA
jgi:ADP-heptose:LPS heptosyltransferase